MKQMLIILIILLSFSGVVMAEGWLFENVLWMYDAPVSNSWGMHGVAVDPDGNIWFGMYNLKTSTIIAGDDTTDVYGFRVVNPNGDELPFSPIEIVSVDGVTDTLESSCRGMATDHNGNILHAVAGGMYRFNYQTGEVMDYYDFPGVTGSLTKPAVDANGNIFIGTVGKDNPVKMLNPDFTEKGNAIAALGGCYNRAVAVSADGKDLYFGSTWNGLGIRHFHSDIPGVLEFVPVDTFGNKVVDDTTTINFWAEDVTLGPEGKVLYGANTQMEYSDSTRGSRYWAFDAATGEELYSIGIPAGDSTNGGTFNGRGLAWSADGNTMYMAEFGYNSVTVWTKDESSVSADENAVPASFKLSQNYPNPFNPETTIPFSLEKRAFVELKVYDVMGREVKTLVNQEMNIGTHKTIFNGSGLASGVYYYRIKVDGKLQAKQMMLLK